MLPLLPTNFRMYSDSVCRKLRNVFHHHYEWMEWVEWFHPSCDGGIIHLEGVDIYHQLWWKFHHLYKWIARGGMVPPSYDGGNFHLEGVNVFHLLWWEFPS